MLTFSELKHFTRKNIDRAIGNSKIIVEASDGSIINFPGFEDLKMGSYHREWFTSIFLDIRGSTQRAIDIGPKDTFVTMQGMIPSLCRIIDDRGGIIVDIPGDGVMGHWLMDSEYDIDTLNKTILSACWMRHFTNDILNILLKENNIKPVKCGIGAAYGKVTVTKIGIAKFQSHKAIGESINFASKLTDKVNNPDGRTNIAKNLFEDSQYYGKLKAEEMEGNYYQLEKIRGIGND